MKKTYIALGIKPDGTALVLQPIAQSGVKITPTPVTLCDLEAKGLTEGANLIGQMLITALCAFYPELDRYHLLPDAPTVISFPTDPPPGWQRGEMRPRRMGLVLSDEGLHPALLVRAYDCDVPIGNDYPQSLKQLAELGKSVAPSVIGEIMLRKLAAMHPDVLSPLFPTMAL